MPFIKRTRDISSVNHDLNDFVIAVRSIPRRSHAILVINCYRGGCDHLIIATIAVNRHRVLVRCHHIGATNGRQSINGNDYLVIAKNVVEIDRTLINVILCAVHLYRRNRVTRIFGYAPFHLRTAAVLDRVRRGEINRISLVGALNLRLNSEISVFRYWRLGLRSTGIICAVLFEHDTHDDVLIQRILNGIGGLGYQVVAHHPVNNNVFHVRARSSSPRHHRRRSFLLLQSACARAISRTGNVFDHLRIEIAVVVQLKGEERITRNNACQHVVVNSRLLTIGFNHARTVLVVPIGFSRRRNLREFFTIFYSDCRLCGPCRGFRHASVVHLSIDVVAIGILVTRVHVVINCVLRVVTRDPLSTESMLTFVGDSFVSGIGISTQTIAHDHIPAIKIVAGTRRSLERSIVCRSRRLVGLIGHARATIRIEMHDKLIRVFFPHGIERKIVGRHSGGSNRGDAGYTSGHSKSVICVAQNVLGGRPSLENATRLRGDAAARYWQL